MTEPQDSPRKARYISPEAFHNSEKDKTKLNWFLFEYAREYEAAILGDKTLHSRLGRKGVDDGTIAEFCIQYVKLMTGQILARVAHTIEHIKFGHGSIEAFFPRIGDPLVDRLLTKAAKAWDSLTERCVMCPTRCISERERRATMFDDHFYTS